MVAQENRLPSTLMAAMRHFTPDVADAYVASIKWPDGECCPKCGSVNVGKIKSRNRYQCREKGCRKQFSLLTGTIFEATHLRLDQWVAAVWMIVSCRNGVSSCEIARTIGCKQQSAWHLLHRVRHILQQAETAKIGADGVECDWTYVGGLFKFMSTEKQIEERKKRNYAKSIVHAIKDRGTGRVRANVLPSAKVLWLSREIRKNVEADSRVYTDAAQAYKWAREEYQHESVDHSYRYVDGECHTNGCENFFNCLRRAIKGTYIRPTKEHLGAYVDESVFRFNVRNDSEWTRFDRAMRLIVGKRLTYSELTDGAVR